MQAIISGIGTVTKNCFDQDRTRLPEHVPGRLGRLDRYSQMGICAAALALKDASFSEPPGEFVTGIIAETETGCLITDHKFYQTVVNEGGQYASPNLFAYTLPSSFLGEAALLFKLTGPTFVIHSTNIGIDWLLCLALCALEQGQCDAMLCGICEQKPPDIYALDYPHESHSSFCLIQKKLRLGQKHYGGISSTSTGEVMYYHALQPEATSAVTNLQALFDQIGMNK